MFKYIQPSHSCISNKVKTSGIEESKVYRRPNSDLDRAIKTFLELDRSMSAKKQAFNDLSSITSDSQFSLVDLSSGENSMTEESKTSAKKSGDEVLLNVLLDSCISCNQVDTAIKLFESLDSTSLFKPDEVTFNTLIKGCSIDKRLGKALELFDLMRSSSYNLKPNDVTFNSMIDVCIRCDK